MKFYIYVSHPELFAQGKYEFSLSISDCDDLAGEDYSGMDKLLGSVDFDIESINREDMAELATQKLDERAKEIRAKCEAECTEIERRKSELLALPHLGDNNE